MKRPRTLKVSHSSSFQSSKWHEAEEMKADSEPRFSVIVPTYNEEKLLPKLLSSLKWQSWRDFEVIVADDGSSDRTRSIAENSGAKLVVNDRIGEYPSRNAAARIATGSLLVFTGADAIMPSKFLAKIESAFRNDSKLVGLYGPTFPYDAPIWAKLEFTIWYTINTMLYLITREANASTAFFAVKRDIFLRAGGFANLAHADSSMSRQLSKRFRVRPTLRLLIFVSGRRTKTGLSDFNRHHLVMVADAFFRFLRNSDWVRRERSYRMGIHSRSGGRTERSGT